MRVESEKAMQHREEDYQNAIAMMNRKEFKLALEKFSKIGDYKDVTVLCQKCIAGEQQQAEEERRRQVEEKAKQQKYDAACEDMKNQRYRAAKEKFQELGNYKDSKDLFIVCKSEISTTKIAMLVFGIALSVFVFVFYLLSNRVI